MTDKHEKQFAKFLQQAKKQFQTNWLLPTLEQGNLGDFEIMNTIGTGAFGTVFLVKHCTTSEQYAMKALEKRKVVENNQISHVKSEVKIMSAISFEFLLTLDFYFKDNVYIFIGMPYINGGEMFAHLRQKKKFDEDLAKFYAAQVVLAFEYLHNLGIIYRDLKPENILMLSDGYIKVTDYGFCKKIDNKRTYTFCGTPEYLAPEVILSRGYAYSTDWWGLGILTYEMVAGNPPFMNDNPMQLYEEIVIGEYKCPNEFSAPLKSLVKSLVVVDKTKRIGCLESGVSDIKNHDWYKEFDWNGLWRKKLKPTYFPKLKSGSDVQRYSVRTRTLRNSKVNEFSAEFSDFDSEFK